MSFSTNRDFGQNSLSPENVQDSSESQEPTPSEFKEKLQKASETQKKLADSRINVLLQRDNVRASSEEIRKKRIAAGDAEATFMNTVRQVMSEIPAEAPPILLSAYARLEDTRNELGVLETDHLDAEQALAGSEWELVDMENDFYQFDFDELIEEYENSSQIGPRSKQISAALPSPPPPPTFLPATAAPKITFCTEATPSMPPPQPHTPQITAASTIVQRPSFNKIEKGSCSATDARHDNLTKDFDDLRLEQARRIAEEEEESGTNSDIREELDDPAKSDFAFRYMSLIGKIAFCEAEIQRSRMNFAYSPLYMMGDHEPEFFLTENTLAGLSGKLSVMQSIQSWLLLELKQNAVHRRLYHNILHECGIDDLNNESLREWATQHWEAEKSGGEWQNGSQAEATQRPLSDQANYLKDTPDRSIITSPRSLDGYLRLSRDKEGTIHQNSEWQIRQRVQSDPGNAYAESTPPSISSKQDLAKPISRKNMLLPEVTMDAEENNLLGDEEHNKKMFDIKADHNSQTVNETPQEHPEPENQGDEECIDHLNNLPNQLDETKAEEKNDDKGKQQDEAEVKEQTPTTTITITEPSQNPQHQISDISVIIVQEPLCDPDLCVLTKQRAKLDSPDIESSPSSVKEHEDEVATSSIATQTSLFKPRRSIPRGPRRLFSFVMNGGRSKFT